jgi:hypothetical protein
MTTNFFSPLSFAAVLGSGIRDKHPGSATLDLNCASTVQTYSKYLSCTAGNKDYQKLSRECVKFRHLLANMPKPTYKDRQDLEDKEAALQAGGVLRIRIHRNSDSDVWLKSGSRLG